jgi:adenosylcobalamin-dependent ribonucleoside-diphosphate reductase
MGDVTPQIDTGTASETAAEEVVDVRAAADAAAPIGISRRNTTPGVDPFDEVEWEVRDAVIPGKNGPSFEQRGVEFPSTWSQTATNIVSQKYFRGKLSAPTRERSVRQMIGRVADTIADWGRRGGYFRDAEEADAFHAELVHLLLHQKAAFNSPVWFNVGFEERPQASACFILSIDDSMDSILEWISEEGRIFRGGSGSGINLSKLRSSHEQLSKGGYASGPVSFMRGADASAGTIKSGGKTRRAAKMVVLDVDHPDVEEFIWCKAREEEKARALEAAGYDMSLDSPDWASIQYQNANNSVRLTDEFMRAVESDGEWNLTARTTGEVLRTVRARDLMRQIADAAWRCADPGVQFDTTINDWHTCPNTGRINASNPCSEYMHVDDSACNLASLNLMRFRGAGGELDVDALEHAVDVVLTAQEILVSNSSYPTERIGRNARAMRQLGLGYANLGALLMARGLAYDSDEGRAYAAAVTALMTGRAYRQSALLASRMGAFDEYERNRLPMLRVIEKHRAAVANIEHRHTVPDDLVDGARHAWDEALELGRLHGYRNAQATVLAPTGTISFLMDCDTTGVEPDFSLVKTKRLVGGGEITIVNQTVPVALERLGYAPHEIDQIVAHVNDRNTVVGAPFLRPEHVEIFDCSIGERAIDYMGHVKPRQDDGRRPALHQRRDQQDREHARVGDDRGRRVALPRQLEARRQGAGDLPRQRQGGAAARAEAGRDREQAAAADDAGRAAGDRAQVPGRRVRGLHPRRALPRRHAGRRLRRHRQGGHDPRRAHELAHDLGLARAAVRRPARRLRVEVQPHALRAVRAHERPRHPRREVARRLHLPLARQEVPRRRPAGRARHHVRGGARAPARRVRPARAARRRLGAAVRDRARGRGARTGRARVRPACALQRLGGRPGVCEVRRPQGAHRLVLHVPRLRGQLGLRLTSRRGRCRASRQ